MASSIITLRFLVIILMHKYCWCFRLKSLWLFWLDLVKIQYFV